MRLFVVSFSAYLLASNTLVAQTRQPDAQESPYTLKTGTNRVLVDVVVKDKKGNPVRNLKQSDFTISENNLPQEVKGFDEHSAISAAESGATPAFPQLPPGQFTNFVPVKQSSAVTVILFDRLNTGTRDQEYVRSQLIEYLKHARPDTRIAIFGLTNRLILLKGFTANPAILLTVLEDKGLAKASPLRDDVTGGGNGVEDLSALTNLLGRDAAFASTQAAVQSFQSQYQAFQSQIQGKLTLDALNAIGRSLNGIPGRKNLIWFTGNFPSGFFPGDNDPNMPYGQFAGLEQEFQETVDLLTSSQIAIYPVDAQGVRTNAVNNAGLANPQYGRMNTEQTRRGLGIAADTASEDAGIALEHLGEDQLAHDTGGQAFYNHNDLNRAVEEAINVGSNYYTIAYTPSNPDDKATFRRIGVKLNGHDYKLSYRRGYYTAIPTHKTETRTRIAGQPAPASSLKNALLQGGPEPTEILLRIKAAPADSGGDTAVIKGNSLNPDPGKNKGPYQAFQIDYATSMRAISIRHTSDNLYHADLDFVTYAYDAQGTLINAQSNTFRGTFTAKELGDTLRTGLPFTQKISIPQSGEHYLRVAVHDNIGDKVGAVEIPIAAIRMLPPPTPPGPAK